MRAVERGQQAWIGRRGCPGLGGPLGSSGGQCTGQGWGVGPAGEAEGSWGLWVSAGRRDLRGQTKLRWGLREHWHCRWNPAPQLVSGREVHGPCLLPGQGSPPDWAPLWRRALEERRPVLFHSALLEPRPALSGPQPRGSGHFWGAGIAPPAPPTEESAWGGAEA